MDGSAPKAPARKEFPLGLPADEDVEIDTSRCEVQTVRRPFAELFCGICSFPMKVKVQLLPCEDKICLTCRARAAEYCAICGFEVTETKVIDNNL